MSLHSARPNWVSTFKLRFYTDADLALAGWNDAIFPFRKKLGALTRQPCVDFYNFLLVSVKIYGPVLGGGDLSIPRLSLPFLVECLGILNPHVTS